MKKLILFNIFLSLFLPACLFADEEVRFHASVNKTLLDVEDTLILTLTVAGTQNVQPPEIPAIEGFNLLYGPSIATQTSIINGEVTTSRSFEYGFSPSKEGTFTIPAVEVLYKGRRYKSDPITVEVQKGIARQEPGREAQEGEEAAAPKGPTDAEIAQRLFVELSVDKTEAVLNEQIILTFRFYRSLAVDDLNYLPPSTQGFLEEELGKQKNYRKVINGIEYEVIELKKALFPVTTGRLEITPAKLTCNLIMRAPSQQRRRSGSIFDEFFGDPFSDSFFGGRYVKRPVAMASKPVTIEVKPLPAEEKPPTFDGAVGEFDLEAEAKPREVSVGDPITLQMKIKGRGNLQGIKAPTLLVDLSLFKTYEPEGKTQILDRESGIAGEKVFEKVLIPNDEKIREIPAVEFSYFDPTERRYQTKRAGPFPIKVKPGAPKESIIQVIPVVGEGKKEITLLEKDIFYIKPSLGRVYPTGERFFHSPLFYGFIPLPLLFFALWVWQIRRLMLQADPLLAKATLAAKAALPYLKLAAKARDPKEICSLVEKSLAVYLSGKLKLAAGAVTLDNILPILEKKGMKEEALQQLRELFQTCDLGRFAAAATLRKPAGQLIAETKMWIAQAERVLK